MPNDLSKISLHAKIDIAFIDPPFHQNLVIPTCQALRTSNYLKDNALIYVESEDDTLEHKLSTEQWHLLRKKKCGQVNSYLFRLDHDKINL